MKISFRITLLVVFLLLQSLATAAEFNINIIGKVYGSGKKIQGIDILVYNRRGELYKEIIDSKYKFEVSIPLDDDYVFFIQAGGFETKIINIATHIEGMAIEDFWGKHKMKVELLPSDESPTQKTLHALERVDWSSNGMTFVHSNIALLRKYKTDFDYSVKKKKYDQATALIYKMIREFLDSSIPIAEDTVAPENLKAAVSFNKQSLEQLLLKRELVKAELEATILKLELLEDPQVKKDIALNINSVRGMIDKLDISIEKAKSDYSQTLAVLANYENIDKELMKLKTQFNVKIELPTIDSRETFYEVNNNLQDESRTDTSLDSSIINIQTEIDNKPIEAGQDSTTKNKLNLSTASGSIDKSQENDTTKKERTKPFLKTAASLGSEIKGPVEETKPDNLDEMEGEVKDIIRNLQDNHKPKSSYSFELKGEKITVSKYETKEGTYEVLSDESNQVQLLKNNVLVTENVITKKEKQYYKKLEKMNDVQIRYDKIGEIKATQVNGLIYRIQIGAVLQSAPHGYRNVSQFGKLAEDFHKGKYKYLVGEFETIKDLLPIQKEVRAIIPGAFAVPYYFGTRITMKHAYTIISSKL